MLVEQNAPYIDAKDGFAPVGADERPFCPCVEVGYALLPEYEMYRRPNLAGPFPTLRCREVVKGIVETIAETTTHIKMTDDQAQWFALGIVRGARIVAQQDEDTTTERFVAELLDKLNRGGVVAIRELITAVNTAAAA